MMIEHPICDAWQHRLYYIFQRAKGAAAAILNLRRHCEARCGVDERKQKRAWFILGKTAPLQIKQATPYL
jgi:hypothetical protein